MLKALQTHHREIARLKFQGFSTQEIADRTGTSITRVYAILRDPLCKGFIAGLMDKADQVAITTRQELFDLQPMATRAMKDILDKDSKAPFSVIANVAKDVLDRNGYKAPERHEHIVGHFTSDDIQKLRQAADNVDTSYLFKSKTLDITKDSSDE